MGHALAGGEKGNDERVGRVRSRRQLRYEERGTVKGMGWQLDDTSLTRLITAHDAQPGRMEIILERRIEAKIAVILLISFVAAIRRGRSRALLESHAHGLANE